MAGKTFANTGPCQGEPPSHGANPFYRRVSAGRTDLNEVAGFQQKCESQTSHRRMGGVPDEAPLNVSSALSTVMHRNRLVAVTNKVLTNRHQRCPFGQRGRERFPRLGNPSYRECVAISRDKNAQNPRRHGANFPPGSSQSKRDRSRLCFDYGSQKLGKTRVFIHDPTWVGHLFWREPPH